MRKTLQFKFSLFIFMLFVTALSVAFADPVASDKTASQAGSAPLAAQPQNQEASATSQVTPNDQQDWDTFDSVADYWSRFPNRVGHYVKDQIQKSLASAPVPLQAEESFSHRSSLDVLENTKEVLVLMDLPGVSKEDTLVEIKSGVLYITGYRKNVGLDDFQQDSGTYKVRERSQGAFQRSIKLPNYIDVNQVKAEQKDGVLIIHLGKVAETRSDVIKVNIQ